MAEGEENQVEEEEDKEEEKEEEEDGDEPDNPIGVAADVKSGWDILEGSGVFDDMNV